MPINEDELMNALMAVSNYNEEHCCWKEKRKNNINDFTITVLIQ